MDKDRRKILLETIALRLLILIEKGVKFLYSRPRKKFEVLPELFYDIKGAREEVIRMEINELYRNKMIRRDKKTGELYLTKRGKNLLEKYRLDGLKSEIKTLKFCGKWTLVFFDIPEDKRKLRDVFRSRLKLIGFYEVQKSVFVYPAICSDLIEFLTEYFDLKRYVRYAICDKIDNQIHLKRIFNLL